MVKNTLIVAKKMMPTIEMVEYCDLTDYSIIMHHGNGNRENITQSGTKGGKINVIMHIKHSGQTNTPISYHLL
jgi:hypothetical protein